MKKAISLIVVLVLCLGLFACSTTNATVQNPDESKYPEASSLPNSGQYEDYTQPTIDYIPAPSEIPVTSQPTVSESRPAAELTMVNQYYATQYGGNQSFSYAQRSGFIPVTVGEQYRVYTRCGLNVVPVVFFNKAAFGTDSFEGIIGDATDADEYRSYEFTIPSGVSYMIVNMREPAHSGNIPVIEKISTDNIGDVPTEQDKPQGEPDDLEPLKGYTIVNLGDSIFGQEVREERHPVSSLLSEYTEATVINCAFLGTRMTSRGANSVYNCFDFPGIASAIIADDFTVQDETLKADNAGKNVIPYQYDRILANLMAVDWSQVDIVTLNYGTNDWASCVTLEAFKTSAIENLGALMEKYPHITFVLITPTWRFWYNTDGTYMEDSTERLIDGHNLVAFCEADEEIAESLNINLIDAYNIGINRDNRAQYFPTTEPDGTHHAENGRKYLAEFLAEQLVSIV